VHRVEVRWKGWDRFFGKSYAHKKEAGECMGSLLLGVLAMHEPERFIMGSVEIGLKNNPPINLNNQPSCIS
jgi:hypothetical protein